MIICKHDITVRCVSSWGNNFVWITGMIILKCTMYWLPKRSVLFVSSDSDSLVSGNSFLIRLEGLGGVWRVQCLHWTKGWSFVWAPKDRRYAEIMRQRSHQYRYHQAYDKKLRVVKDDHASHESIYVRGGSADGYIQGLGESKKKSVQFGRWEILMGPNDN